MKDLIKSKLSTISNPASKKLFSSEGRDFEVVINGERVSISYSGDGIPPQAKREIEMQIISSLKEAVDVKNIFISSISKESDNIKEKPKASLNIGHGPAAGAKKKVQNVKKVIAVSSAKGGVGKSTVTVNLAFALRALGKNVGILDADIYGPSIPMLLNKRDAKPIANEQKKIIPIEAHGISFISFGLFISEQDPVIWRGPMLGGVLNQFLFDVTWPNLDYLIIDLPPGTGDMQLSLVQSTDIDGVIVVSTPQDVALLDSKKGFRMFQQVKTPVVGMIENMGQFDCNNCGAVHHLFGKGGVKRAAVELGTEFLGSIPLDQNLMISADSGFPYMSNKDHEGSKVWSSYMAIAKEVDQTLFPAPKLIDSVKSIFR